jgi:hypothetical protein
MKSALISPTAVLEYVSSWVPDPAKPGSYSPVYSPVPNGQRVAEVTAQTFPVAEPLYWLDCPDDVLADVNYYDTVAQDFPLKPNDAPYPVTEIPGTTTL